jgi:hypothetical protein
MNNRRKFIIVFGATALAAPFGAFAQRVRTAANCTSTLRKWAPPVQNGDHRAYKH